MSLQDLGNVGEFVASLGVIVSLIYLAVQMRGNTTALRAQTRSSITDQILGLHKFLSGSDDFRDALGKQTRREHLTPAEEELLRREASMWFRHMENVQYQRDAGLYDSEDYSAQRAIWMYRFRNHPAWREAWREQRSNGVLSPRLVAAVDPLVADAASTAASSAESR